MAAGGVLVSLGLYTPASAAGRAGDAVIVAPGGGRLTSGGSSTPFSLKVPADAACPGDSANDSYRVTSYLVPATDDPSTLTYSSVGPNGPGQRALFDAQSSSYVDALTAPNSKPGQPGTIIDIPAFTFEVLAPGEVAPGLYNLGIACTLARKTERFWNTRLMIEAAPGDAPAALRWEAAAEAAADGGSPRPIGPILAGAGVATFAGGLALRRRTAGNRTRTLAGRSTEEQR